MHNIDITNVVGQEYSNENSTDKSKSHLGLFDELSCMNRSTLYLCSSY